MGKTPGTAIMAAANTAAKAKSAKAAKAAKNLRPAQSDSSDEDELSGDASDASSASSAVVISQHKSSDKDESQQTSGKLSENKIAARQKVITQCNSLYFSLFIQFYSFIPVWSTSGMGGVPPSHNTICNLIFVES